MKKCSNCDKCRTIDNPRSYSAKYDEYMDSVSYCEYFEEAVEDERAEECNLFEPDYIDEDSDDYEV